MKNQEAEAIKVAPFQENLEHGIDKATVAAHETICSMSDAAHPALDQLASSAHVAVDRAGVAATHAAGAVGAKGDQINASGKRAVEQAEAFVHENPMASLGMAVAFGYVLSRLLSSR